MFKLRRDYPVVIIILCVVLLMTFGGYTAYSISNSIQTLYASYLNDTAKSYGKDFSHHIAVAIEDTKTITGVLPIEQILLDYEEGTMSIEEVDALNRFLERYKDRHKSLYEFYILDQGGEVLVGINKSMVNEEAFPTNEQQYYHDEENGVLLRLINDGAEKYLFLSQGLYDAGEQIGSFILIQKLEYIMDRIYNFELGETGQLFLLDHELQPFLQPETASLGLSQQEKAFSDLLREHIKIKSSGAFEFHDTVRNNKIKLANYYSDEQYGFTVVVTMDKSEIMATPLKITVNEAVMFSLAIILIGTMFLMQMQKFVTPIRNMIEVADRLRQGDYHVRFDSNSSGKLKVFTHEINRIIDDLQEERQRYHLVAQAVSDIIWEWDLKTMIARQSKHSRDMLGLEHQEIHYNDLKENYVHPDDRIILDAELLLILEGQMDEYNYEIRLKHKNGGYHWMHCVGGVVKDQDGKPVSLVGSARSIQKEKDENNRLMKRIMLDPMTGAYNKINGQQWIEQLMSSKQKHQALLLVDLDNFKKINDHYGHLCGDFVITELAARLRDNIDDPSIVIRFGGDEFIVYLVGDKGMIYNRIEELFEAAHEEYIYEGNTIPVSCTMGYAWYSGEASGSYDELLKRADQALYQGKKQGKQCVTGVERKEV